MQHPAVIWDVDGTLVDTAELHFQAWLTLAQEIGFPFTRADFAATFGMRNPEIIPKLFGIHDPAEMQRLGDHKEELYRREACRGVALLPGVKTLLESLHKAGIGQAIGSSAPRANIELILELTGTASFFSGVIAMEDTQRGKPDPQVFLLAAQKLRAQPEKCWVMEDAPAGIQAARAGGMSCVGVTFVGHHDPAVLVNAGANLVVDSLANVTWRLDRGMFAFQLASRAP
jgi:beta-phosphoglucomutase